MLAEARFDAALAVDAARPQVPAQLQQTVDEPLHGARRRRLGIGRDQRQLPEPLLHHRVVVRHFAEVVQLHADVLARDLGQALEREFAAARLADAVTTTKKRAPNLNIPHTMIYEKPP